MLVSYFIGNYTEFRVGEAKATAITNEREKGKFKSFEDFQRIEGIRE